MGGPMQPQGHVQILCNIIDFGMNVQAAGDAARYIHLGSSSPTGYNMTDGGDVGLESGVCSSVETQLIQRGHKIIPMKNAWGGYQAILWDKLFKVYHAATEMRKDGQAAGY